jgi:hypothetical protein
MRLAIMQPYFFPYIGYFQLLSASDKFVFYDDVNFIKGGWINRNRLLVGGKDYLFTVPLDRMCPFEPINNTEINEKQYFIWQTKLLKTIEQNYKKAPYFNEVFKIVNDVTEKKLIYISELASLSITTVAFYLGISSEIVKSSSIYSNSNLKGAERVLDICKRESASVYINAIAGEKLYLKDYFIQEGFQLKFLKPKSIMYKQFKNYFVPWLSIIDVMMFNSVSDIKKYLNEFELV